MQVTFGVRILLPLLVVFLSSPRLCDAYSSGRGPNVCGTFYGLTLCCKGWTKSLDGLCTTAICDGNCGERGSCIAPNQCRCEDGRVQDDCLMEDDNGYLADEPVRCPSNCNNQGRCINGKCVCDFGFKGSACDEEEVGPCFIQTERGVCKNKVTGPGNETAMMTRNACCGSIGVAWGGLCQRCSAQSSYCGKGYIRLNHQCVDTNECEIPNVCMGGICRNTDGSFECDCPYGYVYDKNTVQCRPILDGCQKNPKACTPGGRCIPLHGTAYICQCDSGYVATDGNTRCRKEEVALNYCEIFEGRLCKNGECHPTASSYECTCNPGYVPSRFKKQCIKEFNACTFYGNSVCTNGQCLPVDRSFRCICNPGYVLSGDGTACLDKCQQLGPSVCQNGFCVPRPYGDYECRCHYGYQPSPDRKSCLMQLNPFQTSKREPLSSGNIYRGSYQADWPQENRAYHNVKPQLGETRWQPSSRVKYPNPCADSTVRRKCMGGFCINLGRGSYECRCYKGYRAVNGNQQCVADYGRTNLAKERTSPIATLRLQNSSYVSPFISPNPIHSKCRKLSSPALVICIAERQDSVHLEMWHCFPYPLRRTHEQTHPQLYHFQPPSRCCLLLIPHFCLYSTKWTRESNLCIQYVLLTLPSSITALILPNFSLKYLGLLVCLKD
ncbi:Fibrillin-3 [Echinococcus granulosus]|uniref:Fibrillin-3 n=1 Tax=Echinococcus granulosus TaxID=6210 RepID=W6ULH9_ECHGR|nr:Fibrillin-3 [Echinococcus granulosus]EUB61976.1 Fibrillin-3 [Echinococcus granulosus]